MMRCIFCKKNSGQSKSKEHIIPESLGNKTHVLVKGTICDDCNSYFSIKIENKVLNTPYFKSLRHRNEILSKKRKLPTENGFIIHPSGGIIEIASTNDNILEVIVQNPEIFKLIERGEIDKLYIPIIPLPEENDKLTSRFLLKVGFEALADKVKNVENWNEELVDNNELDIARDYVRYGKGEIWPYSLRRVYHELDTFIDFLDTNKPRPYQVLHEYDFLFIDKIHLYFVCIIMGVEYAVNIADRTLEHYLNWLKLNNGKSPLEKDYQKRQKTGPIPKT